MLNMCVESELDIVGNTLLEGWVDGWMDGWVDGSQSRVKDCLQQSINFSINKPKMVRLL